MPAGDRTIKIKQIRIFDGDPVPFEVDWQLTIEDKSGLIFIVSNGTTSGTMGSVVDFNKLTGADIKVNALDTITLDTRIPVPDKIDFSDVNELKAIEVSKGIGVSDVEITL